MEIRFAERKDIHAIAALCKAHAAYEKAAYTDEGKAELLTKHLFDAAEPELKCVVVEAGDELVGYATFIRKFSTWDAAFYLYLDCLYLNENERGKGIGTQLMKLIKDYAKSVNCSIIQWQTPVFNEKAIKFYNRLGAASKSKERFTWMIH